MNRTLKIVVIGFFLAAPSLYFDCKMEADAQVVPLYLQNKNYPIQTGLHAMYKTEHADVVMLGNSLTQWVDWNELLGRRNIANRGIASDVTDGYLHRMEYIYKLTPTLCFIEGGINDIFANVSVKTVFENYQKIVGGLRSHRVIPIMQSTLFVSPKWHDAVEKNKEVAELNALLEKFAKANAIEFIDLNTRMSENNTLRDEFTHDGVHLTAAGYKIWGEEVEKVLKHHNQ